MRDTTAGWLAAAFVVAATTASAWAGEPGTREWHQDAANGARTSAVDVAPIRNDPVEAWHRLMDDGILCDPVTWGGAVFVMSRDPQKRQILTALDARTGEVLARVPRLSHTGEKVELAAWEGVVVAVEPGSAEAFAFKGNAFKQVWRRDGKGLAFPCIHKGMLFVADRVLSGSGPTAVEEPVERIYRMPDGKELGRARRPFGGAVSVTDSIRPGLTRESVRQIVGLGVGSLSRFKGTWLFAQCATVAKETSTAPGYSFFGDAPDLQMVTGGETWPGVAELEISTPLRPWYGVIRVVPEGREKPGAWFFLSGVDLKTADGTPCQMLVLPDGSRGGLLPATIRPAARAGRAYTFDQQGNLLAIDTDGLFHVVLEAGQLPRGAVTGTPTIARDVIYFGNWAADLESRRVLWIRPIAVPRGTLVSPAIPIGDGLVLLRASHGELFCLADPKAATPPAAAAEAAPAAPTPAAPGTLPGAADGVLLQDGRQLAGAVRIAADGSVLFTSPGGSEQRLPASEVVVAQNEGIVVAHGLESDVHRVWRDALRAAHVRRLEELFPGAISLELPAKASEIVERARVWGMSDARAAELTRTIAGKRDAVNLDLRLKAFAKREASAEDATYTEILAGAAWCGARAFPAAGATLLTLASGLPTKRDGLAAAAAPLVPADFPLRGPNAAAAWLAWAPFVVAADAHFLGQGDPAWRRTQRPPWDKGTIGLRTPNLLFFTRSDDAAVVGPCLSRGERAVRALRTLLGVEEAAAPATDDDRLEVRLHREQAEYLAEAGRAGMEWTLGYFSPAENVSRFYVPAKDDSPMPLGRGLFKTMAHELTHHYVEMRWAPRHGGSSPGKSRVPGYWVVEGIARFVEDQVVDAETRGLTFADPTVASVDAASQLARAGKLLPMTWFCDAEHDAFNGLSREPALEVRLARSLVGYRLSEASAFYEQAGALVFYLWNQRGPQGRAAFVEYLRLHYNGVLRRASWEKLGFESADALAAAFRDWLTSLGR